MTLSTLTSSHRHRCYGVRNAAFTPAQHVARQQVARTSNLLWATSNLLPRNMLLDARNKLLDARNKQLVAHNLLPHNMLRWCKRGLMLVADTASVRHPPVSETSTCCVQAQATVGDRSFAVAGPRIWNSLPGDITLASSILVFCHKLNTRLLKRVLWVGWLSGRTSVSDRRTFTGLHRTCS